MAEIPDFEALAREGHCPVCMEGLGALYYNSYDAPEECPECNRVAAKLRTVWNLRGAADLETEGTAWDRVEIYDNIAALDVDDA